MMPRMSKAMPPWCHLPVSSPEANNVNCRILERKAKQKKRLVIPFANAPNPDIQPSWENWMYLVIPCHIISDNETLTDLHQTDFCMGMLPLARICTPLACDVT